MSMALSVFMTTSNKGFTRVWGAAGIRWKRLMMAEQIFISWTESERRRKWEKNKWSSKKSEDSGARRRHDFWWQSRCMATVNRQRWISVKRLETPSVLIRYLYTAQNHEVLSLFAPGGTDQVDQVATSLRWKIKDIHKKTTDIWRQKYRANPPAPQPQHQVYFHQHDIGSTKCRLLTVTNRGRNIGSHLTSTPSNAGCAEMGDNDQSQQSSTCAFLCVATLLPIVDPNWNLVGGNKTDEGLATNL